ncbi:MAG: hypothetical protein MZV63_21970 [Marinilabiliales bacterium]|nr:hypothetical protein [Marinilabiliales bacterium]
MQLIGANRSFIRKPFLLKSLFFGFLAALIAIGLLMGLMYLIEKEFFTLFTYENINLFLFLCLALVAGGSDYQCCFDLFCPEQVSGHTRG